MANQTPDPYQAYFNAMMDMQKEMANQYFEAQKSGQMSANTPPPWMMGMSPFMMPGHCPAPQQGQPMHAPFTHPHMMMHPQWQGAEASPQQQAPQPSSNEENNALFEQAQAMLDNALGEDASTFKEILGSFAMNDKEFWKGAMVGAAAALILGNENVRGKLMGLVSGAGDMLKTGGSAVKESASSTASAVKTNVANSSEIFKDTYAAGKQGFQQSVEKHKSEPIVKEADAMSEVETHTDEPAIKEQ